MKIWSDYADMYLDTEDNVQVFANAFDWRKNKALKPYARSHRHAAAKIVAAAVVAAKVCALNDDEEPRRSLALFLLDERSAIPLLSFSAGSFRGPWARIGSCRKQARDRGGLMVSALYRVAKAIVYKDIHVGDLTVKCLQSAYPKIFSAAREVMRAITEGRLPNEKVVEEATVEFDIDTPPTGNLAQYQYAEYRGVQYYYTDHYELLHEEDVPTLTPTWDGQWHEITTPHRVVDGNNVWTGWYRTFRPAEED